MGVNKNISILMLYDCVRVNTGLVLIESVIVNKRGGICELMMITIDSRKNISILILLTRGL